MRNRIKDSWGKGGMVTPLVDVVFNLMITMFIFLMIYMAVVVPEPKRRRPPVTFLGTNLPPAAPYQPYTAAVPLGHGSGRFHVRADSSLPPEQGEIRVDSDSGLIQAALLAGTGQPGATSSVVRLQALAVDRDLRILIPPHMASGWNDGSSNRFVFFHEEWPTNLWLGLDQLGPGESPGRDALRDRVEAHFAVRTNLALEVRPQHIPYDPSREPLRLTGPLKVKGVVGFPLDIPLGPMGGIEPYEYAAAEGPAWLALDPRQGRLHGTPDRPGSFSLDLQVKDAQTPAGDWATATRLRNAPGNPLATASITVDIEEFRPLQAHIVAPLYGRVGQPFQGALVAHGGAGRKRFSPVRLPPGLSLDPDSGLLSGQPTTEDSQPLEVGIQDDSTNVIVRITAPRWRGIIAPLPPSGIIGGNPTP